jgi:hypothetical protein
MEVVGHCVRFTKYIVEGHRILLASPTPATAASTRSTFDRPPAGVGDAVALDHDLSAAHPHGLALCRGEPLADQVGQHVDGEAIGEKPRFGVAAWTAGENL